MFAAVLAKGKKMNSNIKGFVYGIATSATFGLIPLFTLPLMAKGMQFDSILFYRFLFASIVLVCIMASKKESLRIDKKDIPVLVLLGFFYTASAMFLFWGYNFMSAGSPLRYISLIRYSLHLSCYCSSAKKHRG